MAEEEYKLVKERERGTRARQILENDIWQEAWAMMEANLRAHMEDPESSEEVVLEARRGLLVLRKVHKRIESVFKTGKMADIQLERIHGRTGRTASGDPD